MRGFALTFSALITVVAATAAGADATAASATDAAAAGAAPAPAADATAADASASAAAPAGDLALLARITAQAKAITTVAGTFTQKTTGCDDGTKIITGTFAIEVPDKYSVVEARPGDPDWRLRLWSDGQTHWQSEQQFAGMGPDVSVHDGDADLERILACLRGDFAVLAADYRVSAEADPFGDGAVVVLTPRGQGGTGTAAGAGPVRIVLDHDLHARSVGLDQPGGQHIQVEVTAATYGQPSPDGSFTPPKP